MDDKSVVPTESLELVRRTAALASRGLQVISEMQQIQAVLADADILPFMNRFNRARHRIGAIPDEFVTGAITNPHDIPSYDVNSFLDAFSAVTIRPGYVLDYVYDFDGRGGEPLVYARNAKADPLTSPSEYYDRFSLDQPEMLLGEEPTCESSRPYLSHLQFENTPMGCFQFAVFCMNVCRFYLYWHSNYNDRKYILTSAGLGSFVQQRIGRISDQEAEQLSKASPNPRVAILGQSSRITLLSYELNIGYSHLHIDLRHPNTLESIEDETIIKSHSEVLY